MSAAKGWLLVPLLGLFLVACSSSPTVRNDDVDKYIDPSIQGTERDAIRGLMRILPPEFRQNVILYSDDKIYVNRPELREEARLLSVESLSAGLSRYKETGEVFVDAPVESPVSLQSGVPCSRGAGSGVFFRVQTRPGPGGTGPVGFYSAASAKISLPGTVIVNQTPGVSETVYIMLGGFGDNGAGATVDAGIQYNTGNRNWSLYLRTVVNGVGTTVPAPAQRFSVSQSPTVNMYFDTPADNRVRITVAGTINGQPITISREAGGVTGWRRNGFNNIIKRTTALAQSSYNLTSGALIGEVGWDEIFIGGNPIVRWSSTNATDTVCRVPDSNKVQLDELFYVPDASEFITLTTQ